MSPASVLITDSVPPSRSSFVHGPVFQLFHNLCRALLHFFYRYDLRGCRLYRFCLFGISRLCWLHKTIHCFARTIRNAFAEIAYMPGSEMCYRLRLHLPDAACSALFPLLPHCIYQFVCSHVYSIRSQIITKLNRHQR